MKKITLFIALLFIAMASFAEIKVEKLWEASAATDPSTMPTWMASDDCRDMVVMGDKLYVATRTTNSLRVIDLTAENMADAVANATELKLTGDLTAINSLAATEDGQLLGCSFASKNLVVVSIDVETGATTKILDFTETGANGRFDYFNASGDFRGTGYIYAALSSANNVYRWTCQYGEFSATPDTIALSAALGSSAIVVPAIAPQSMDYSTTYDAIFLMSQTTDPDYWMFTTEMVGQDPETWDPIFETTASTTAFPANTFTAQGDKTASGAVSCKFAGKDILVSTLGRLGGFEVIDYSDGVANATKIAEATVTATLGATDNKGTVTAPIAVRAIDGDSIHIIQCVPNNGIVAYTLYNYVQPVVASTIAEVKAVKDKGVPVTLKSADGKGFQLTFSAEYGLYAEDATGAIALADPSSAVLNYSGGVIVDSIVGLVNHELVVEGWWGPETFDLSGQIYVEALKVLDETKETITYTEATVDQVVTNAATYEYRALEFKDVDILMNDKGENFIKGNDTTLVIDGGYNYEAFPAKATIRGYYGEKLNGMVFHVEDMQFEESVYTNLKAKGIVLHNRFAVALPIDGVDYAILTDEQRIPTNLDTIVGYTSKALDYYSENGIEVAYVKNVFVASRFTYTPDTIKNFTATVGKFNTQTAKFIDREGVQTVLQAPHGAIIPTAGDLVGYDYFTYETDANYNYSVAPAFWIESSVGTAYAYIDDFKNSVPANSTSEIAATITEPMLVEYVETFRTGKTTLYVMHKNGTTIQATAVNLESNDKNIKAGDIIKNVKGYMTPFYYSATDKAITTGSNINVNPMDNTIEIVSSGNVTTSANAITRSYGISYFTGSNAKGYDARYVYTPMGQIVTKDVDGLTEYYFNINNDSIQIVAYDFVLSEKHVGKCAVKGILNAKNNGPSIYLILTDESDIVTENVQYESIADLKANALNITGVSHGLKNPVLLTYVHINEDGDYYSGYEPYNILCVQDATGAMRINLDTMMTRTLSVVAGDSILIDKGGDFDSYNTNVSIKKSHNATIVAKNSNNPLVPVVITVDEFKANEANYNAMLVKFENVEFVKGKHPEYPTIDRYFFYQDGKSLGEIGPGDWNDGCDLSKFEYYPFNDIVAVGTNGSWAGTSDCHFVPVHQDSIKDVTPIGAAIAYMCRYDEQMDITYIGKAQTTIQTPKGVLIQDASNGAILLEGVDSIPAGKFVTNAVGTYYPASEDCMARFKATSLEIVNYRAISYVAITMDELVANMAQHEGQVMEIEFNKTELTADGKFVTYTSDSTAITVVGDVVPQDCKIRGAFYRIAEKSDSVFYVAGFDYSDYGRYNVIMFHDFADWYDYKSNVEKTSYNNIEGFTQPVLLNSIYTAPSGFSILNVQDTTEDGTVISATIEARTSDGGSDLSSKFHAGDSIYNIAGFQWGYEEEITAQWQTFVGRRIEALTYTLDYGDPGYPEKEPDDVVDGENIYYSVEVYLGNIIKLHNSGNELSATEMTDITPLLSGVDAVPYQGQRFKVKGIVVVDTTSYEDYEGITHYEYDVKFKVGEQSIGLTGYTVTPFAGQEVTIIGTFDLGCAVDGLISLYISAVEDILIENATVDNIAEFLALAHPTAEVTIAGEVAVTYQNKANIYVQDETGSLLIFDDKNNFENGDRFTGLKGTFKDYFGTPEMVDATFPEVVKGATVLPTVLNIENLDNADLNSYVVLHNVEFFEGLAFSSVKENNRYATVSKVYTIPTDSTPTLDTVNATVYNSYLIADTIAANTKVSVVGIVAQYKGARQIAYISNAPYVAPVAPEAPTFTPDGGEFVDFVSVAIACATEGTEIYYTLVDPNAEEDAEDNTENGADDPIAPMALDLNEATLYSAPFELRETTKVEAYAQLKDVTDEFGAAVKSNVVTALFTIKEGGNAIDQVELTALVYSNNGMIYVQTEAGNMIEVFTVQGQCIYASEATSDVTAINALNAEVLLVKVNNSTVKVSVR